MTIDWLPALDYEPAIELAGWHDAWKHELRGPHGQWIRGSVTDYQGTVGSRQHITRVEHTMMPTAALARMPGVEGEIPGQHAHHQGPGWQAFKADIAAHGIRDPVFITVDHGEQPKISEGSNRRDAAVELGMKKIPVEIHYFGHAEQQGSVASRVRGVQALSPVYNEIPEMQGISRGKGSFGGQSGRDLADAERLAAFRRSQGAADEHSAEIGEQILEVETKAPKGTIKNLLRNARVAFEGEGNAEKASELIMRAANQYPIGSDDRDKLIALAQQARQHPFGPPPAFNPYEDDTNLDVAITEASGALLREARGVRLSGPGASEVYFHLNRASAHLDEAKYEDDTNAMNNSLAGAAEELNLAADEMQKVIDGGNKDMMVPFTKNEPGKLRTMARNLGNITAIAQERAGKTGLLTEWIKKNKSKPAELLGGGREAWNGNLELTSSPEYVGMLKWDGTMRLDDTQATHMKTDLALYNEPVSDMQPYNVILHELIHGVIPQGSEYTDGQGAYQDKYIANIEEGFTELGTIQHMGDWLRATGMGSRPTNIISIENNHVAMTPLPPGSYEKTLAMGRKLDRIVEGLGKQSGSYSVYTHLSDARDAFRMGDLEGGRRELERARNAAIGNDARVRQLDRLMTEAGQIPGARTKHDTFAEYADRLNDPSRIKSGDVWGHYATQTARAMTWAQDIAHEEGFADLTTPEGKKRVQELSDEINRQGSDGKIHIMAEQAAKAAKLKPLPPKTDDELGAYAAAARRQAAAAGYDSGSHGGFRHPAGLMTSRQWSELEDAIRRGFAIEEMDHTPMRLAKSAMTAVREARSG